MSDILKNDVDPIETLEWLASLESLLREEGPQRASVHPEQLAEKARASGVDAAAKANRDYINTIPSSDEPAYPGDLEMERRIRAIIRWNAMMIVLRASKKRPGPGWSHVPFASSATIYEVCTTTFFRARNEKDGGDSIWSTSRVTSPRASTPAHSPKVA